MPDAPAKPQLPQSCPSRKLGSTIICAVTQFLFDVVCMLRQLRAWQSCPLKSSGALNQKCPDCPVSPDQTSYRRLPVWICSVNAGLFLKSVPSATLQAQIYQVGAINQSSEFRILG